MGNKSGFPGEQSFIVGRRNSANTSAYQKNYKSFAADAPPQQPSWTSLWNDGLSAVQGGGQTYGQNADQPPPPPAHAYQNDNVENHDSYVDTQHIQEYINALPSESAIDKMSCQELTLAIVQMFARLRELSSMQGNVALMANYNSRIIRAQNKQKTDQCSITQFDDPIPVKNESGAVIGITTVQEALKNDPSAVVSANTVQQGALQKSSIPWGVIAGIGAIVIVALVLVSGSSSSE